MNIDDDLNEIPSNETKFEVIVGSPKTRNDFITLQTNIRNWKENQVCLQKTNFAPLLISNSNELLNVFS